MFASAIAGGTLVSLLSFLLVGLNRVGSRFSLAYVVGFLLALGPFDHVVVTMLSRPPRRPLRSERRPGNGRDHACRDHWR
ncbi:hypothetical protein VB773_01975 [Haloarculaceae archaeon H-GB2-1]|nr:hypothetical protein [Haloarculaceae archaeon H-GB2-1]